MNSNIQVLRETSREKISKYISWAITIVSIGITVYLGFFRKSEPKLEYDIVSSATFINNKESAAYLKIFIDTIDIQENHLNISTYNIKVENKGNENISCHDYDKGFFGLKLSNGTLLEPPTLLEASSEHIRYHYTHCDSIVNETFIAVPEMSLDKGDYYIIRVVLLHNIDSIPSLCAEGKIVGQKEILVNNDINLKPKFWFVVFGGNWLVQLVRFIAYLTSIILMLLLVFFIGDTIDTIKDKHKRKQIINELNKKNILEFVKEEYINNGSTLIEKAHDVYNKSENDVTEEYKKSKDFINSKRATETHNPREFARHESRYRFITKLIEKKYLIRKENDTIVFNKEAKRSVNTVYSVVAAKGMLRYSKYINDLLVSD